MITNLKRDNQRLIEENAALLAKLKEKDVRGSEVKDNKEQPLINSIKKARKLIESFQGSKTSREESGVSNFGERLEESSKAKRSSLSSIRINK